MKQNLYYENSMSLAELIDGESKSVYSMSKIIGKTTEETFSMLSESFESAEKNGKLTEDSDGIHFETEFAFVTLKRNLDYSSRYERYLGFELKDEFALQFENTECEETPEALEIPSSLDDVILSKNARVLLNKFMTGQEALPGEEIIEGLKKGYKLAYDTQKLIPYERGYNFQTGFLSKNGETIVANIKPIVTADGRNAWVLNYVGVQKTYSNGDITSALRAFADMGSGEYLTDIASLARKESWGYAFTENGMEILKNYIAYTFYKLQKENKIRVNEQNAFAAFNTGLASDTYDDIYMCFKKRFEDEGPEWKYMGSCVAARGCWGKQLVSCFNPLPQQAKYIEHAGDIIYDREKALYMDYEHIIYDRLHRIPLEFLKKRLAFTEGAEEYIKNIEAANEEDREKRYSELCEYLKNDLEAYNCVREGLESVKEKTMKMLRWNYRLAIPCYYPKDDKMSLLLPMDFTNSGEPQAALVVELRESGNYIGHTLLSMNMAYVNARLISSQESSWLKI